MSKARIALTPGLLPHSFKRIGFVVVVLALLAAILIKVFNPAASTENKELFRLITMNSFLLGLLFMAWSRDKQEDEMTLHLRLRSVGWSFAWIILTVIISPIVDKLFHDPVTDLKSQELVLSMMMVYFVSYYIQKRVR